MDNGFIAAFVTTFSVIFLSEIGDRTFFIAGMHEKINLLLNKFIY